MGKVESVLEFTRAVQRAADPWIWLILVFAILVIARAIWLQRRTQKAQQQALNEALSEFHSAATNVTLQCEHTKRTRDEHTIVIARYREQLTALEKKFDHTIRVDLNKCGPFPRPPGYSDDFPQDLEKVLTQIGAEVLDCEHSVRKIGSNSRTGCEIYEINNITRRLDHCGPLLASYRAGIEHKIRFIEHLCSPTTIATLDHVFAEFQQIVQKNAASQGAIERAFSHSFARVIADCKNCLDQHRHGRAIEATPRSVGELLRDIERLETAPLRLAEYEQHLNRLNEICANIQTHYVAFKTKYPGENGTTAQIQPHCDSPLSPSYYLTHLARAKAKVDEFKRSLASAKYYITPPHVNLEQFSYAMNHADSLVLSASQLEREVPHIEAQRTTVIERTQTLCSKLEAQLLADKHSVALKWLADLRRKLAADKFECAETLFNQAEEILQSTIPTQENHSNGVSSYSTGATIGAGVDNGPAAIYAPLPMQDSSSSAQYDYPSNDSSYSSGNSDSSSGPSGGGESGGGGATSDL